MKDFATGLVGRFARSPLNPLRRSGNEFHGNVAVVPGAILSLFLFSLTVGTWPGVVERVVSLDWKLGNMRPVAFGLQLIFGSLTVVSVLARERINYVCAKTFPTRKRLVFALIAFSISLLISLIVVEISLRLLGLPFKEKFMVSENAMAQFDLETGWSYIPDRSFVQQFGIDRREVAMHFDSIGSRVRAPGVRRDPAAPTVLFVGCSITMGHAIPYEETFVAQLESMPGFPFQVVNLGVQAYGADQALLLTKRYFKTFNTKVVVYSFINEHIERNANYDRRILFRYGKFIGTKPLFALRRDGTLYLKKKPVKYEDLTYSHLWACIERVWTRWGPVPTFDLTRALIHELKDYVDSNGATFIVVNWDRPSKQPLQQMDLNLIDTNANAPYGWRTWRIPGDGHPDARANLRVAQLIFEEFKHLDLITK